MYHAAVRMMLNAGVPAERRAIPELGVLLVRPPSAGCAGPHRENCPEVGVPLPARRSAWWGGCRDLHHPGNCTFMPAGCAGWARSWAFLPVGAGTAARSAAKGVYHAAVRMTLNAGVPAERRAIPELRVLPAARLRRAVPGPTGRTAQRSAFPCRRVALHGGVGAETGAILPRDVTAFAALRAAVPTGGRRSKPSPRFFPRSDSRLRGPGGPRCQPYSRPTSPFTDAMSLSES